MRREDRCSSSSSGVTLKKVISLLPTDYANLTNLPTINGVSLLGDLALSELSILSSSSDDYETVTLSNITDRSGKYIVILGESGEDAQKMALDDFVDSVQTTVTASIDENAAVGSVQFVTYS